jgi:hypothetical protein
MSTMTAPEATNTEQLGTGHPNKILQKDYAKLGEPWFVRLETMVPIGKNDFDQVKKWLEDTNPGNWEAIATYLVDRVPMTEAGGPDAQHMVAAAFGFELGVNGRVEKR